jgi:hypothetical protein
MGSVTLARVERSGERERRRGSLVNGLRPCKSSHERPLATNSREPWAAGHGRAEQSVLRVTTSWDHFRGTRRTTNFVARLGPGERLRTTAERQVHFQEANQAGIPEDRMAPMRFDFDQRDDLPRLS